MAGTSQKQPLIETSNQRLSHSQIDVDIDGHPPHFVHGEIIETREPVEGFKDRHKVVYTLQTSNDFDDSSFLYSETSGVSDASIKSGKHCHSNVKAITLDKKARRKLIIASVLCLFFMVGEMVGGFLASSLAIMSDAAHMLTDFASFMISLVAMYLTRKPATKRLSFGWYRAEILGALISILLLWVLTGILVYTAVLRLKSGEYDIDAKIMLITAAIGVAFNILMGTTLHQHGHSHGGGSLGHSHGGSQGHSHGSKTRKTFSPPSPSAPTTSAGQSSSQYGSIHHANTEIPISSNEFHSSHSYEHPEDESHGSNINVKAAFIHVLGDLIQSIGVLIAAFIIYFKPDWKAADPICTFLFSLFVLVSTVAIMRDILLVLMEGTPRGINFNDVRETLMEVDGVLDIHNLRIWALTMDKTALSVHLAIDKRANPHRILTMASQAVREKFDVRECTIQIEIYVTGMDDCTDCRGPSK